MRPAFNFIIHCHHLRLIWLVETSNGRGQRLQLGSTTWYVRWRLDPVHQALLVILDTLASELALGLATVGAGHIDLTIGWHQILQVTSLFLLFALFLSLLPGELQVGTSGRRGLRWLPAVSHA